MYPSGTFRTMLPLPFNHPGSITPPRVLAYTLFERSTTITVFRTRRTTHRSYLSQYILTYFPGKQGIVGPQ